MSLEQFLENFTLEEIEELKRLKLEKQKCYSFRKIRDKELHSLFDIKRKFEKDIFDSWFKNSISLSEDIEKFLKELLIEEADYIEIYDEEDLKMRFLSPILRKINFKGSDFRDFYNEKLVYETDSLSIAGEVDFVLAKGLEYSEIPYFFIQEFKRSEEFSNPRSQLIAELICATELNDFIQIKGAYIIGSICNFRAIRKT